MASYKNQGSYYKATCYALKARLGPMKAIIAVAHRIFKAIYYMIKHGVPFQDSGEACLLERNRTSKIRYLGNQLALLGFELKSFAQAL